MRQLVIGGALVLALGGVAAASPSRFSMQVAEDENVHLADQRGAINRSRSATIDVELLAAHKARVVDAGTDRDSNLYEDSSSSEHVQTWTNRWTGTWALEHGRLQLDLTLDKRACTNTKTWRGQPPETLPCPVVTKQVILACTSQRIELEGKPARKVEVWSCAPSADVELARTPRPWLLGKSGCVRRIGGMHHVAFERCP